MLQKYVKRVINPVQVTGTGTEAYLLPTPGVQEMNIIAIATMGNSADLTLTVKYADDATGTTATAFSDVPIYINGTRQATDTEVGLISDASGNFIVEWVIDPGLIPAGKYIGISYANSHNSSLFGSMLVEKVSA